MSFLWLFSDFIASFKEIVFLRVVAVEDISHVPRYTESKYLVGCLSEWFLIGGDISLMEQ